ncbi:MAG TPA: transposase, partial [Gaiellaceae bacterium]|nr:transposase [Gaiellaceae bacterium]
MARALRPNIAGGIYHVTARGVRRQPIFEDEREYERFRELLRSIVEELRWVCHAYCQMPNHYHLVIETPQPNLSVGMQRLNSRYAAWFNWRRGHVGHVFESRFYSGPVESNAHLLEVARYVVLNPVRARLCPHPGAWTYSSYRARGTARLLGQFGDDPTQARRRYEEFVAAEIAVPSGRVL